MGKTVIGLLAPNEVMQYLDRLTPLLHKPLRRMGADKQVTARHILEQCINGQWQCWVTSNLNCVFITQIVNHPTGYRVLSVYLIGGAGMKEWLRPAWERFKEFGRKNGCKEIVGRGRKGWVHAVQSVEAKKLDVQYRISVEI